MTESEQGASPKGGAAPAEGKIVDTDVLITRMVSASGMTIKDIADRAEMDRTQISRLMRPSGQSLTLKTASRIASACGVDLSSFLAESDRVPSYKKVHLVIRDFSVEIGGDTVVVYPSKPPEAGDAVLISPVNRDGDCEVVMYSPGWSIKTGEATPAVQSLDGTRRLDIAPGSERWLGVLADSVGAIVSRLRDEDTKR